MKEFDLIIRGGTVVLGANEAICDVGVRDGLIVALQPNLNGEATSTVEASGLIVMPGGVDTHVHIEQPSAWGAEPCDTFATGSASAAAGGTTTVVCFAWQSRGQSIAKVVADYSVRARKSIVDYAFHLTITDPTETILNEELPALIAAGNRSIKIFMTYKGLGLSDRQILNVLDAARRYKALVCVHAENDALIEYMTEKLLKSGLTKPKYFPWAKPIVAEREAVHRIIALSEALDVPIEVFHVSGEESAAEIERAQRRGLKVWAETCPQYLTLLADDLDRPGFEGAKFIFGPPARTIADQEALWNYIRRGVISVISSDHSATRFNSRKGKKIGGDDAPFTKVPNGIPGLAARLPVIFSEGVSNGRISLSRFVELVSTTPAKLMGLYPRKGIIAIGSDADLVVWDPKKKVTLTNELMHHASDYTPYEGMILNGFPTTTYLRGRPIFDSGNVLSHDGGGTFLTRAEYGLIEPRGRFPIPFNPVDNVVL